MKFLLKYAAKEGTIFHANAFEQAIGKRVPVSVDGVDKGLAIITRARVIQGGKRVLLTVETDAQIAAVDIERLSHGKE